MLLTGFWAFGEVQENPTRGLAEQLAGVTAHVVLADGREAELVFETEVLSVDEAGSRRVAEQLSAGVEADVVLQLGVAERALQARLEVSGANRLDQRIADTNGRRVRGEPIEHDGPASRAVAFDVTAVLARVDDAWLRRSDDAGGFVCNETLYRTLGAAGAAQTRRAFLHVPPFSVLGKAAQLTLVQRVAAALAVVGTAADRRVVQVGAVAWSMAGRLLVTRRAPARRCPDSGSCRGGTLEPGEDAPQAITRELSEELGTAPSSLTPLRTCIDRGAAADLILHVRAAAEAPTQPPVPSVRDALEWAGPERLTELDWVRRDRELVPRLVALLQSTRGA